MVSVDLFLTERRVRPNANVTGFVFHLAYDIYGGWLQAAQVTIAEIEAWSAEEGAELDVDQLKPLISVTSST